MQIVRLALHTANVTQPTFAKEEEVSLNGADANRIRWHRIANVNETIEIGWPVSQGLRNHLKLAMALPLAAFIDNTSLIIAIFSSLKSIPISILIYLANLTSSLISITAVLLKYYFHFYSFSFSHISCFKFRFTSGLRAATIVRFLYQCLKCNFVK